jgi:hypothetical protein
MSRTAMSLVFLMWSLCFGSIVGDLWPWDGAMRYDQGNLDRPLLTWILVKTCHSCFVWSMHAICSLCSLMIESMHCSLVLVQDSRQLGVQLSMWRQILLWGLNLRRSVIPSYRVESRVRESGVKVLERLWIVGMVARRASGPRSPTRRVKER